MIGSLKVLGVVPARGGSKRVPGKNLRVVGGKPLIEWTTQAARRSNYIDHLAVSSDDAAILELARRLGCDSAIRRPDALAADHSPGIDPVLHALGALPGFDIVVLLQPTSPLRRPEDIDACIERCAAPGNPACISVTPSRERPEWLFRLDRRGCMIPILPEAAGRDIPSAERYLLNGAVYAARVPWIMEHRTFLAPETVAYVMPDELSLDIDTPQDMALAEFFLSSRADIHG